MRKRWMGLAGAISLALVTGGTMAATGTGNVTRATLDNGLRVVIVRDTLAPVVTTEMNYLVGSDEVPQGFPGTAHAVEHMMFRGSPGLDKNQLLAIAANMGGDFNADTTNGVTQYYFTAPAQDLDVALHVAATRMRGVDMSEAAWKKERGAIEQEVSRDNSNPIYKFLEQLQARMFEGTPYAWTGLGTRPSFNKTTAAALKQFHDSWYAPNNAILVIAGDVDPKATLQQVKSLFGNIPKKTLPARPQYNFKPMQAKTVKLPSDLPVGLVALTWRMPGLRSKDYATALVLSDALGSKRGKLFELGLTGKALFGTFGTLFKPHAGIGFAEASFPRGGDSAKVLASVKTIMAEAAAKGVPAELVVAAKRKAVADLEYKKNSVAGLANAWSRALAFRDGTSPDDIRSDIAAVTPEQVNALAQRIFNPAHAMTAILTPVSSGKPSRSKGFGGAESFAGTPSGPVTLPPWAKTAFAKLSLPDLKTHPSSFTLANGLRVIVQPESVSKTVEVFGRIKTNSDLQAPKGQKGVAQVLDSLFNFGTTHMHRLQFETALDAIAAHESAGASGFSLMVPSANFAKGMQLLATNELHPNIPPRAFMVMQHNQAGAVAGRIKSPGFLNSIHLGRALYPANDPIQRYATPKSIAGLTLKDVQTYYQQTVRPDMTTIVIIGDVTPAQAHKVAQATFGGWKASGPKPNTVYPAVPANKPSEFRTPDSSAVQDSVTLSQTIPMNENSPSRYALNLGNMILGGGGAAFNTRLMQDLRVKGSMVYFVHSSPSLQKHRGTFNINYGCDPDKVGQARALVIRDIKQMQTTPVTASELHFAKGKMLRELALGGASFSSIASNFLSLSLQGKPLDSDAIAAKRYMAMTATEIQAVFKKDLRPNGFVTAVKGPASK